MGISSGNIIDKSLKYYLQTSKCFDETLTLMQENTTQ
jgi:hypothetical protein